VKNSALVECYSKVDGKRALYELAFLTAVPLIFPLRYVLILLTEDMFFLGFLLYQVHKKIV